MTPTIALLYIALVVLIVVAYQIGYEYGQKNERNYDKFIRKNKEEWETIYEDEIKAVDFQEFLAKSLKDPEFKKAYDKIDFPETRKQKGIDAIKRTAEELDKIGNCKCSKPKPDGFNETGRYEGSYQLCKNCGKKIWN